MSDITFLEDYLPSAAEYYQKATQWYWDTPDMILINLRSFLSLIVDGISEANNISPSNKELYDRIESIKSDIPGGRYNQLHDIRKAANKASHPESNYLQADDFSILAKKMHRKAFELATWYIDHIYGNSSNINQYQEPPEKEKYSHYYQAVTQNNEEAQLYIAKQFLLKSDETKMNAKQEAAKKDIFAGMEKHEFNDPLGILEHFKWDSVNDPDLIDSFYWLNKSSNNDNPEATMLLGISYIHEKGCNRDLKKAWSLMEKACTLGCGEAFFHTGIRYLKPSQVGLDEPPNTEKGIEFLERAISYEVFSAYGELFNYYASKKTEKTNILAFKIAQEQEKKGYEFADYNLAVCYQNGIGIDQDDDRAYQYLEKSSDFIFHSKLYLAIDYLMNKDSEYFNQERGLQILKETAEKTALASLELVKYYLTDPSNIASGQAGKYFLNAMTLPDIHDYKKEFKAIADDHEKRELKDMTFRLNKEKIQRNDKCPCGSDQKFKKCHGELNAAHVERIYRKTFKLP